MGEQKGEGEVLSGKWQPSGPVEITILWLRNQHGSAILHCLCIQSRCQHSLQVAPLLSVFCGCTWVGRTVMSQEAKEAGSSLHSLCTGAQGCRSRASMSTLTHKLRCVMCHCGPHADAVFPVLCTAAAGIFRIWTVDTWVHLDAGLDSVCRWSNDPGTQTPFLNSQLS